MRRRRKITFAITGLALALLIGWPVSAHFLAKWRVEHYKQLLRIQGEKLTVAELVPAPSRELNGASALIAAVRRIGSVSYSNALPAMRYVVPGHALLASKQPVLPTEASSNVWPGLGTTIEAAQDDLAGLRAALNCPTLDFNLDYSRIGNLHLGHLTQLKTTARWLSTAAILELHEGQTADALENLNALSRLSGQFQNEPLIVSERVRIAMSQAALNATWEALHCTGLSDEPLTRLQANWESLELIQHAEAALAMDRVLYEKIFAASRDSFSGLRAQWGDLATAGRSSGLDDLVGISGDLLSDPGQGLKKILRLYPGYWSWKWWWSYEDELVNLQYLQAAIEAMRRAHRDGAIGLELKRYNDTAAQIRHDHPGAGRWLEYLDFYERMVRDFLVNVSELEMERRMVIAAIALERYQLKYHRYPPALDALAPEFAREVPRDAMNGKPLQYRLETDGSFVLYSVAADGEDNGGDPTPTEKSVSMNRQFWRGRDAVWPQPASTEEFKIYEATLRNPRRRDWASPRVIVTNGMSAPALKELEQWIERYNLIRTNRVQ